MALAEHEEQAFWEFVTARRHSLVRTAYLLTGDHAQAEDFAQDALIRVHRNWRRIERVDQPEAYARKIIVNLVNSWWRRAFRLRTHPAEQLPDGPHHTDGHAAVERADELWRALQRLPAGMRTVIVLRYYEDLSEAETAAVLSRSLGTVKSQSSRGLARLRELLTEADPAHGRAPARQSPYPSGGPVKTTPIKIGDVHAR
jgi:RNA polymerase sigma-70 factor (sigma-E family)